MLTNIMPRAQNRVAKFSTLKDDPLCPSRYVIYQWVTVFIHTEFLNSALSMQTEFLYSALSRQKENLNMQFIVQCLKQVRVHINQSALRNIKLTSL